MVFLGLDKLRSCVSPAYIMSIAEADEQQFAMDQLVDGSKKYVYLFSHSCRYFASHRMFSASNVIVFFLLNQETKDFVREKVSFILER